MKRRRRTTMKLGLVASVALLGCSCVGWSDAFTVVQVSTPRPMSSRAKQQASWRSQTTTTTYQQKQERLLKRYMADNHQDDEEEDDDDTNTRRRTVRKRVSELARRIVVAPIKTASSVAPMPQAVAAVLKDATLNAVDLAVEEAINLKSRRASNTVKTFTGDITSDDVAASDTFTDVESLIDEAFLPLEETLNKMETQLLDARDSLKEAKQQSFAAMKAVAIAHAEGAVQAVKAAEKEAGRKVLADLYVAAQEDETMFSDEQLADLSFEDVDFMSSEMAPPFLNDDQCLVPGEPVCRVEKAPENSRRIFAGIDIPHSVDDVWNLLTDYAHLQDVVPNLVVNDVLAEYNTDFNPDVVVLPDDSKPEQVRCKEIAEQMKGSKLRQVGGAKVAGIRFSARTTLDVREWPQGLPDIGHFNDEMFDGKSRNERADDYTTTKLKRYKFPRPFALSKLPSRDITMQSIEGDNGEFRMYQGVWRMQPLPGCSPPGQDAMRLTYAVEVSPRAYLPVQLVERRIVTDLCANLVAIRDFLAARKVKSSIKNKIT